MKGWLDKYGKELNANEGYSSAPDNWVGEGYSTQGRNYSPAWGGQFKDGGKKGPGDDIDKKEKAKKIVEIARRRIANNDYVEVPEDIKNASYAEGKNPYGCIGGVCTVAKEAGALPRVYWSNTGFAKDAPNLGFPNNGYGLKGIQNLEPGDFIQYLTEPEGKDEEGNVKYIPRHTQIFLGVNPDTKQYEFFDNQNKAMMSYPESMIKDKLKNTKHPYDYGAVIYKNNPFHPTANSFTDETLQDAKNRVDSIKREKETPTKYKYSIRSDAKDYNNDTKDIMNTFVNYANDNNKLNNLVSKLEVDKEEIHDSLLNVFGELGQENNWTNTGKGVKSKLENIAEKTMAFFGGGKNYSIGPGQNKFSNIPKDLRDKFGIKSTKDLYNLEKVIPLMVGQDILNKKTLRNWGEKNLLSDKLIGHTDNVTPLIADDLKGGVGRWSPYLRNEYGLISNNKRLINNNDLIPFNTDVVPNYDPTIGFFMNPHKLDEGSYPDKVFHKTDDNLQRELITPSSEKFPDELSPFTVISKKRDGGYMSKEVQFAMGGSMPGSVGFTYARTNNPAPSNGPYAKKTKASAQNGDQLHPIDLHLPIYEKPKLSLNPYAFYVHPKQDVHVAGIGAHAQDNINDRLNLSGGLHSTSVLYPGGEKMFMKPEYHVGMKYRFDEGGSMSYYQHGLDWKPKSMEEGGWLDKYEVPKNQDAKYVLPRFDMPRAISESTSMGTKIDEEAMREASISSQRKKQGEIKKAAPKRSAVSKAWAIATHPMTALAYKAKGQDIPEHFEMGETNPLEYATDVLNPATYVQAAANTGEGLQTMITHPQTIGDQLLPTLMSAATVLPLVHEIPGANKLAKQVGKTLIDIPRAKNIKEAIGRVAGIPLEKDIPRMAAQDVKSFRQVQEIGRLKATGASSANQMKYALENNIPEEHFQKVFGRSREEAQNLLNTGFGQQEASRSAGIRNSINLQRPPRPNPELARLRAQNTFEPVDMTPEEIAQSNRSASFNDDGFFDPPEPQGADIDVDVARDPYNITTPITRQNFNLYTSTDDEIRDFARRNNVPEERLFDTRNRSQNIQDALDRFNPSQYIRNFDDEGIRLNRGRTSVPRSETLSQELKRNINDQGNKLSNKLGDFIGEQIQNYPYYSGEVQQKVPGLFLNEPGAGGLKNVSKKVNFAPEGIQSGDVFTGSTNTSHSSYLPQIKQVFKYTKGDPQFLGYKPMNSLGFLSGYGYEGEDIAKYLNSEIDEQIKRGVLPKDISRPYLKDESVMLPHYGVKQHKKGGVIKDDMGQWAHPGEITEIGSNRITMQGVDYPVLGISDKGDTKMMLPGEEYKFKGKKVTEYPMKKNGGWLDKYK